MHNVYPALYDDTSGTSLKKKVQDTTIEPQNVVPRCI